MDMLIFMLGLGICSVLIVMIVELLQGESDEAKFCIFVLIVMFIVIGICIGVKIKRRHKTMTVKEVKSVQVDTVFTTSREGTDTTYIIKYAR